MRKILKNWLSGTQNKKEATEYEHFVAFQFLHSRSPESFQIDESVVERLRIELAENENGLLSFDTLKQRRCIVNLEHVVSAKFYQDEKQSLGTPIDGIYIRLLGQKDSIEVAGDVERFSEQLTESQSLFLEAGNQYINRQMLLMAAYDIA